MMGSRGMRGGTEYDAFHRRSRAIHHWQRGVIRWVKRQFSKRQRRAGRAAAAREAIDA